MFLSFTIFWRNSDSYEYKNKLARRWAQFIPIGMQTTCWNCDPPKETNMLSMRNSSILITCSSEYHALPFWILFEKYVELKPNTTNFEPSFLWLKALWMVSFKRVFNLSRDRVVYRVEKSQVLMEDTWEKDLDARLSKRSLEFF